MGHNDYDVVDQVERHLACSRQAWLLGAGISFEAGVPLMAALTERVLQRLRSQGPTPLLDAVAEQLKSGANVEHILTHLGYYSALADRSKTSRVLVGPATPTASDLRDLHAQVQKELAFLVRVGFVRGTNGQPDREGKDQEPVVRVDDHRAFVQALFGTGQAGLRERRDRISLFTTNYDTLIEDALALAQVPYWDGFEGGAVAFRTHRFGEIPQSTGFGANVIKLHGSIDWRADPSGHVLRVRHADTYPGASAPLLIYPQSTKYTATQRDPFAAQFDLLRKALAHPEDNTLAICGYSFGDEHINEELKLSMARPTSRTTVLAFCQGDPTLPDAVREWQQQPWGSRVYAVTSRGICFGRSELLVPPASESSHNWWTFKGVTALLLNGATKVQA
jgi:hypothetical protein